MSDSFTIILDENVQLFQKGGNNKTLDEELEKRVALMDDLFGKSKPIPEKYYKANPRIFEREELWTFEIKSNNTGGDAKKKARRKTTVNTIS